MTTQQKTNFSTRSKVKTTFTYRKLAPSAQFYIRSQIKHLRFTHWCSIAVLRQFETRISQIFSFTISQYWSFQLLLRSSTGGLSQLAIDLRHTSAYNNFPPTVQSLQPQVSLGNGWATNHESDFTKNINNVVPRQIQPSIDLRSQQLSFKTSISGKHCTDQARCKQKFLGMQPDYSLQSDNASQFLRKLKFLHAV